MAQNEEIRTAVRIIGKVQGVGFRWFVQTQAERLGLRGWVCNTSDGHVELEAVGTSSSVEEFRQRIQQGPPAARVYSVVELPVSNDVFEGFVIRR